MPKVNVYNMLGEIVEEIELDANVFGIEINQHVVYEVVKNQLANKRQGTQSTKTRSEVRGGGRKPWKQKGTGRARAGSLNAPNEIIVIDKFDFDAPKTKAMVNLLSKLNADKKALIVMDVKDVNVVKSADNIPNVATTLVNTLNVYDILKYNSFIITKDAVRKVEEVYA